MASTRNGGVVAVLLAAIGLMLAAGAAAEAGLSVDFHAASCPQLDGIVRAAVQAVLRQDVQVTAGLLRIFFHDCLPQGCDASILLDGERSVGPNGSLQPRALRLIEEIRAQVHRACGPTISCADIIAVATSEAVSQAGGPKIPFPLGRSDSLKPASQREIFLLPGPTPDVNALLDRFRSRGLADAADLVALSGGHTVGKASCGFIRGNDDFSRRLSRQCSVSGTGKQSLDVITPDAFDNKYFVALTTGTGQGVMASDQALASHPSTSRFVRDFARNQAAFFDQFVKSMIKMGNIKGAPGGEIRRNCAKTNRGVDLDAAVDDAGDEGFAASA